MSWTWRGKGFLCHGREQYAKELANERRQKQINARNKYTSNVTDGRYSEEYRKKYDNRLANFMETQYPNVSQEYIRKIRNRAKEGLRPVIWMRFKEYFCEEMMDRLARTGLVNDSSARDSFNVFYESEKSIKYKKIEEQAEEIARELDNREKTVLTRKGRGDGSWASSRNERNANPNPRAKEHRW